jgi:hypothetical protein
MTAVQPPNPNSLRYPLPFLCLSWLHALLTAAQPLYLMLAVGLAIEARMVLGYWPDFRHSNPWTLVNGRALPHVSLVDAAMVGAYWAMWPWALFTLILLVWKPKNRWLWLRIALVGVSLLVWMGDPTGICGWSFD